MSAQCMAYHLKRGDKFTVEGSDTVWTFDHMDGMYCYATDDCGLILNWCGPVKKLEAEEI